MKDELGVVLLPLISIHLLLCVVGGGGRIGRADNGRFSVVFRIRYSFFIIHI